MKTMTATAAALTLCAQIATAEAAPDLPDIPEDPMKIFEWVQDDMTCLEYMAVAGAGDHAALTVGKLALLLSFSYMYGIADTLDLREGEVLSATTLTCMLNPDMLFSDAPFDR